MIKRWKGNDCLPRNNGPAMTLRNAECFVQAISHARKSFSITTAGAGIRNSLMQYQSSHGAHTHAAKQKESLMKSIMFLFKLFS